MGPTRCSRIASCTRRDRKLPSSFAVPLTTAGTVENAKQLTTWRLESQLKSTDHFTLSQRQKTGIMRFD